MSRCFPFPPPGYEKKLRPEEGDLLKEEKRKEKKHKKEKKDKEKREGKEKRDRDRSDGKHREKKEKKDKHRDKKEKHKDKKKDKDRDKDKEKSSISEEGRVAVPPGASSGGKLHERDEHKDRQISSEKGRDEHKERHISSEKAKLPNQFHVHHGEKPFKTSISVVEAEDPKFVQELDRRIRDEEKGAQSQLAERSPVEWKRDEKSDRVGIKVFGNLVDREKNKERGSDNNKMDAETFRGEHKIGANATPPSFSTMAKNNFEGFPRPVEQNVGKREETPKPKERHDDKPREKNKDKEREKHSHGKQKDKEKEKKKEEKSKDKNEHKRSRKDKSKDNNKNDFVVLSNNKPPLVSKENTAGTATKGIVKKRKNVETNGFLHESEVRPAKLLRPSSSQQSTQNGKKLDTHPKADMFSSIIQGVASDIKVENKEHKVNGSIEGQPMFSIKATASSMIPGADQIAETSKKPLFSVKAKDSSVIPGADLIAEASKKPLFSVKAKDSSVIPGAVPIAEASKKPLFSVKAKDSSVIPGADLTAEASKKPLFSVKAKDSSVIPGADQVAGASKKPLSSVKARASSIIPGADQIAEASKRPPHPDSKYLSQILSVPEMDDWSGFDDQEWLSGSKRTLPKSTEMCLDEVKKEHCVWSEALQIDSADVCALPYVIPY
ncbi:uncharacterized protein LOC125831766 isoform X1 [Solanum verrucosum]|uniref:uncharacterized protein LOC125831766 isoform X1 n=1 Tax=Solanum verrucosum TaxID=315347 RepID=UPI0020D1D87B|nr:uncharacterized protein LOC125831766 isoform X1 [Solanum verrucosum]XP_049366914.1 uncharacterized protein LOC125831766 isoform X1 [Solanum verrucosum]